MQLSIITVNYKSWGHLEAALDAMAVDFPANWEFIVVDNESQPESFAGLRSSRILKTAALDMAVISAQKRPPANNYCL